MSRDTLTPLRQRRLTTLRRWIYAYFLLILFEGVLRKWGSFGFMVSSALLLIRDPVVLVIYYLALQAKAVPRNIYMRLWGVSLVVFSLLALLQVFFNPWLNSFVAIYGIRCYCLHTPLIFVIGQAFEREDLLRIGRWTLLIAGPMALLMVAQFLSPPSSFLNRATLGEGSEQIAAALGRVRPAGTFSYGTGATSFNLLMAAFLLYSFIEREMAPFAVRLTAAISLVAVLPVSGSRTFVLSLVLLLAFAFTAGLYNRRLFGVTVQMMAIGAVLFLLLTLTSFFREGLLTFSTRWQQALGPSGSVNDAIVERFFGEFIHAFEDLATVPILGYGIGLASNVGTALTVRSLGFLLAETEWERTVMELGSVAGLFWLSLRCSFVFSLYRRCWAAARRKHALPWLLLGTQCLEVVNGLIEQTTNLGFLVFTCGLCFAAIRVGREEDAREVAVEEEPAEAELATV